ncbi:aldose 1-epimerase isoform X1 [Bos indicus x Bos taurus]|uniref:Aldose 1-epimerase n=1 Tax=Bos indicus x Bos taurus TaxID=30522 RepID=A0A4W2IAI1_BOBOX|nr:aldose 1-epimerase isoform X1 [Bos indicus x Bos taurus]
MVSVTRAVFGDLPLGAGTVEKFQLQSDQLRVDIISWGCTITALEVKDRQGRASDVVLGFDELEGYLQKQPYFGAVVGRVANRIAKGTFTLDGKEYKLAINNGPNSLHGGVKGFDKVLWTPRVLSNGVEFSRVSPDGEEGYPGELKVWVMYTLDGGELVVNYRAQASQTTPVNLTNHSYFNLAGQGSPNIYDHEVTIEADAFLPVDEVLIPTDLTDCSEPDGRHRHHWSSLGWKAQLGHPHGDQTPGLPPAPPFFSFSFGDESTAHVSPAHSGKNCSPSTASLGEIASVQGTAFDLRKPVELGKHLQEFHVNGFDHNFCLKGSKEKRFCARVHHAGSGRVLEVYTTQPGVQFYTGNFLDGTLKGKSGAGYPKHSGFCLETQSWPDAVNQPHFPPVLLKPGEEYDHTTWFKFSVA